MATEHFFQHTSVSGKTPLPLSFFDGWLFHNFTGHYTLLNPIPDFCKNGDTICIENRDPCAPPLSSSEFMSCTDFSLSKYNYTVFSTLCNGQRGNPITIPSEINKLLLSKPRIVGDNCEWSTGNAPFSKMITIPFSQPFLSEPHVSYFITPIKDSNVSISIEDITCEAVTFRIKFCFYDYNPNGVGTAGGKRKWLSELQYPHPDTCIHWHAVGAYAPPITNLLD
jgi:hypothetical protein